MLGTKITGRTTLLAISLFIIIFKKPITIREGDMSHNNVPPPIKRIEIGAIYLKLYRNVQQNRNCFPSDVIQSNYYEQNNEIHDLLLTLIINYRIKISRNEKL